MRSKPSRLSKNRGSGDGFLVLRDGASGDGLHDASAVRWCDRRTGVGAGGLLVLDVDTVDADVLKMVLFNADGSPFCGSRSDQKTDGFNALIASS